MQDKASRSKISKMNRAEFAYNQDLLREINGKLKASNYES